MLRFDTTQPPARPAEWAALLDAVFHADDRDEDHWIEWKSSVDFNSTPAVAKHICRTILGFANRDPDEAAGFINGIGILLVGLEPGNAKGVTRIDNADLDQKVSPLIGTDGPIWQPHWYQYDGVDVLIVEVGAPHWGDVAHCFRKATDGFGDGDIYVRHKARTAPANHRDVQRLLDRYTRRPSTTPTLEVEVRADTSKELRRYTLTESDLDRYVAHRRRALMEPLDRDRRKARASTKSLYTPLAASFASVQMRTLYDERPEPRNEKEYEREVDDYLGELREAWPKAVQELVSYVMPAPTFRVTNQSSSNYRQLEVKVHVAGDADVAWSHDPDDAVNVGGSLPEPPRAWGPIVTSPLDAIMRPALPFIPNFSPAAPRLTTRIERGGSFDLTFVPVDLRPGQTEVLEDELVVLVPATRPDPVIVDWTATATNVDTIAQGSFELAFAGENVDGSKPLADILIGDKGTS